MNFSSFTSLLSFPKILFLILPIAGFAAALGIFYLIRGRRTNPADPTAPNLSSSSKIPKKTILLLLIITIIAVSVPVTIFLVKQRQEVRKEAAGFGVDGLDGANWNFYGGGCFGGSSPYAQIPSGWVAWSLDTNRCVQRETFIKLGTYSIKITNKQDQRPLDTALSGMYRSVKAVPNATYTLRGQAHRFYDESADFVGFQFCNASSCRNIEWHPLYGKHGVEGGNPNSWYSFQESSTAPSDALNLNVFVAGGINSQTAQSNPNDVYFDNIELVETVGAPTSTPTPTRGVTATPTPTGPRPTSTLTPTIRLTGTPAPTLTPTPTQRSTFPTSTPSLTPTPSRGIGGPTATLTPTPTNSVVITATPTPTTLANASTSPTKVPTPTIPEAGIAWPTIMTVIGGLLILGLGTLLAL